MMDILELVEPTMEYKEQVMAFKAEMLEYGSDFDGSNGLRTAETYEEWLDFRGREEKKGRAPSHTWLTVRQSDGRVVGIVNYRPSPLSDFLLQYGGHIGYCIRPFRAPEGLRQGTAALDPGEMPGDGREKGPGDLRPPGKPRFRENHPRQRRRAGKRGRGYAGPGKLRDHPAVLDHIIARNIHDGDHQNRKIDLCLSSR